MEINQKHKIIAVSYINTYPFIYGLRNQPEAIENFEVELAVPSECARKLKDDNADIGLIPVGALPDFQEFNIVTDFCIGANGKVKTVLLLSQKPLDQIEKIYLDTDSRTSVNLVKILAKNFWKITPEWAKLSEWKNIEHPESVVLIGDKTFGITDNFKYKYDLAEEWKNFTGLPFVFAVWVTKKAIESKTIDQLNKAFKLGIKNINLLYNKDLPISNEEFNDYLTNLIDFNLGQEKHRALNLYLQYLKNLESKT